MILILNNIQTIRDKIFKSKELTEEKYPFKNIFKLDTFFFYEELKFLNSPNLYENEGLVNSASSNDTNQNLFLPHVIEPSFGIGRIMYLILEHNFCQRVKEETKFV